MPTYLPEGAVFIGAYLIDPPYDALYPDPAGEEARCLLRMKNRLLETQARLEEQAQSLRDDLAGLDELRSELEAKVMELEALHSRQEIGALWTEIAEGDPEESRR